MKRALFLLQFRRTVVSTVMIFVALDIGMALISWSSRKFGKFPDTLDQALNGILLAIGIGLAIPIGATAFSRDYKETHHFFIHSLPLPLETIWIAIAGASFAAWASAMATMCVLRPSLFAKIASLLATGGPRGIAAALLAPCLCFSAGACFVLCFRRD